ncbi:MAG: permease [Bacteroidales bacterium]
MEQITLIIQSVLHSFASIWPYLLITIPLAVAMQVSGFSKHIRNAFSRQPLLSILLATLVGAFSPFCSCGVVPLIASLLIGGVPLAPVMSFWLASPSTDPELIPLSIATIGWNLSLWRLGASLCNSLLAGIVTHFAVQWGFLGENLLRNNSHYLKRQKHLAVSDSTFGNKIPDNALIPHHQPVPLQLSMLAENTGGSTVSCCIPVNSLPITTDTQGEISGEDGKACCTAVNKNDSFFRRIAVETRNATWLLLKFMGLAFLVTALIKHYVPQDLLHGFLHLEGSMAVFMATLVGIPTYTSNMLALPLIGHFLEIGMNPGAALAFLMAGPVTTLPAIIAVWGIAGRRVFLLYLGFSVFGAVVAGLLMNLVS